MGRLLDIARQTRSTLGSSSSPVEAPQKACVVNSLPTLPPLPVKPPYGLPTAAVISLIAEARQPVPHSTIIKALAGRGHSKGNARQAIAWCQGQGWIEHNLVVGYVLLKA